MHILDYFVRRLLFIGFVFISLFKYNNVFGQCSCFVVSTPNVTNVQCGGDGMITINGWDPCAFTFYTYEYQLTGTQSQTFTANGGAAFTGLQPGNYWITVTDVYFPSPTYGCSETVGPVYVSGSTSGFLSGSVASKTNVSCNGLNERFPSNAKAITNSGLAMKFIVSCFPSFLPGKLRLYDVTMVFCCRRLSSGLCD